MESAVSIVYLSGGQEMLVLSRKVGEKIYIGDDIIITVVKIDRNKVRIGIEASKKTLINREEVQDKINAGEPHLLKKIS